MHEMMTRYPLLVYTSGCLHGMAYLLRIRLHTLICLSAYALRLSSLNISFSSLGVEKLSLSQKSHRENRAVIGRRNGRYFKIRYLPLMRIIGVLLRTWQNGSSSLGV
jgi:hypothetical protein